MTAPAAAIAAGERAVEEPDATDAVLDAALCNFCNSAGDPFTPASQWDEGVDRAFAKLCKAYNQWCKAGCSFSSAPPAVDRFEELDEARAEIERLQEKILYLELGDNV